MTLQTLESCNFTPELNLLIHCLTPDCKKIPLAIANKTTRINWPEFLNLAQKRHRVAGQVFRNVKKFDPEWMPAGVIAQLKKIQQKNTFTLMRKSGTLIKLLNLFDKNDIRALPIKGPFLGMQLYGDIVTRNCNDLDILIPEENIRPAVRLIEAAGFRLNTLSYAHSPKQLKQIILRSHHFSFTHTHTNIKVELHWKLFSYSAFNIPFDRLWERKESISVGGKIYPVCGQEDTLMLLLVHGSVHHWRRLFWLNDIQMLLSGFSRSDWQRFFSNVNKSGLERLVVSSLTLLKLLFNLSPKQRFSPYNGNDPKNAYVVYQAIKKLDETEQSFQGTRLPKIKLYTAKFYLIPGISGKLHFIFNILFVPDFEYLDLPEAWFYLYYMFRPYFWCFRKFTSIKPVRTRQ